MKLGVVIPTLDEADAIESALRSVVGLEAGSGPGDGAPRIGPPGSTSKEPAEIASEPVAIEVVVVDGGSRDDTCQRARTLGAELEARGSLREARVIEMTPESGAQAPLGRSRQLQAGLAASSADALLFLHADTRLPPGWPAAVAGALADPGVVGGAFRFRFDPAEGRSLGLRIIEWGAQLRVALFGMPYGDQALFARRATLEAIGGVPQAPIMEDLDLVAALKRQGRLARLRLPATTSSRRYREQGVGRTFLRNLGALVAWRLGIDRGRIAAWYRR